MRFGLALPHYDFSLAGEPASFEAVAGWARRAEELGFDSVWVSDHLFYSFARYGADPRPWGSLEPVTTLAGVTAVTDRVHVGTLVLCTPFRTPAVLAKEAATIDALSGGRLELGLGAGWLEQEFDAFGFDFGTVGERFRYLERTLHMLRETEFHPPMRAPIWVGGKGGPRLLRLAAAYADGWNVVWRISPAAYATKLEDLERASPDRELRRSVGLHALVAERETDVVTMFEEGRISFPGGAMDRETFETYGSDTLTGTVDQAIERVHAFEDLGVEELILSPWVLPFSIPRPEIVEALAERVFPACR
jgi:alkanesulfonate monooxygenase SsuD/methylene tetrahydromethanopterin reductase-like flavin-dependent oxidoreductase (luciferase family)